MIDHTASRPAAAGITMPALFLSHGSPMLVSEDIPARDFIAGLGRRVPRPRAILCISAHWDTAAPTVSGASRPQTIHDFHGFPPELYELRYPAPGAPALAARLASLLDAAGLACRVDPERGLDHGAWNPLLLLYPEADVPVTQLSIQSGRSPQDHLALGRAIAPLRDEGVLILGSGGAVHNLGQFRIDREKPAAWAVRFDDWLAGRIVAGDADALAGYRQESPDSRQAQPSDDHFLPLLVALGAGSGNPRGASATILHRSFAHGSLSMAAYGWGMPTAA
jgi:4,5-DOPA dioxygenase extradiol